jgi:hypothetical protein
LILLLKVLIRRLEDWIQEHGCGVEAHGAETCATKDRDATALGAKLGALPWRSSDAPALRQLQTYSMALTENGVESGYAESIIITLYLDKSAKKENTNGRTGKGATTTTPKLKEFEPGSRPPSRPSRTHPNKANWGGANKGSRPARRTSRSGRPPTSRASIDKPRFNEPGRGARAKSGEHRRIGPEPTSWERFNESGEHRQTGRAPTSRNSRISQWCSYWTVALQRKSPNCEFIKSPYCHTASAQPCCPRAILPNFAFFGQFWRGKKAPPAFLLME